MYINTANTLNLLSSIQTSSKIEEMLVLLLNDVNCIQFEIINRKLTKRMIEDGYVTDVTILENWTLTEEEDEEFFSMVYPLIASAMANGIAGSNEALGNIVLTYKRPPILKHNLFRISKKLESA